MSANQASHYCTCKAHAPTTAASALPPLADFARGALQTLRLWRDRRRQRHALSMLSDHLLRDIGVSRQRALVEAAKPFWR